MVRPEVELVLHGYDPEHISLVKDINFIEVELLVENLKDFWPEIFVSLLDNSMMPADIALTLQYTQTLECSNQRSFI